MRKFDWNNALAKLEEKRKADREREANMTPEQKAARLEAQRNYRSSQIIRSGIRQRNHV